MTCCGEPCRYQKDGLCTLPPKAQVGLKAGGCCYFASLEYGSTEIRRQAEPAELI